MRYNSILDTIGNTPLVELKSFSPRLGVQIFAKLEGGYQRDKEWAKRNKLYYIIFSHQYYPEPPYARVFYVYDDDSVVEGKIEMV